MKNNTKIRLHLSKNLFESLAKQVVAEAKKGDMSGGAYTEAVKAPKTPSAPVGDKAPEAVATKGAAKGANKTQVGTSLMQTGRDLNKNPQASIQSSEGGVYLGITKKLLDILDDKDNAAMILTRVDKFIDNAVKTRKTPMEEMETRVAEEGPINESEVQVVLQDLMQFLQDNAEFLAGVGGITGAAKWIASQIEKNPEARKTLDKATGAGSSDVGPFGGKSFGKK
jgi:glutamine synthetase adenylyltransferase